MWIQYSDYFIPKTSINVEGLVNELSDDLIDPFFKDKNEAVEFFKKEAAYDEIYMAENESELDMLYVLIDKMFLKKVCSPNEINVLLTLQENPTYGIANHIQYQYGLKSPLILNLSGNECCNFEYALYVAERLLATDPNIANILIAGSVKHPAFSARMTNKFSLNGDASGIMLVSREKKKWKYEGSLMTNVNTNPSKNIDTNKSVIYFDKLLKNVSPEALEQPYKLILQNANVSVLHYVLEKSGFDLKNLYISNNKYPHLYTLDLLVNTTGFIGEDNSETKTIFLVGTSNTGVLSLTTFTS